MIYAIEMINCHWYRFYNFRRSFNALKGRTLVAAKLSAHSLPRALVKGA